MNKLQLILQIGLLGYAGTAMAADDKGPGHGLLENLDTNGDGLISLIEFQGRDDNALTAMDTDGNGVLTIDEMLNARPNMGMRMERGDRNGPGPRPRGDQAAPADQDNPLAPRGQREPSAEEIELMQELHTLRATERFQEMDTNGDEIVTLAEFQTVTFAGLDRNDDGVLDAQELRPARMGRPDQGGERPNRPRGEQQRNRAPAASQ